MLLLFSMGEGFFALSMYLNVSVNADIFFTEVFRKSIEQLHPGVPQ